MFRQIPDVSEGCLTQPMSLYRKEFSWERHCCVKDKKVMQGDGTPFLILSHIYYNFSSISLDHFVGRSKGVIATIQYISFFNLKVVFNLNIVVQHFFSC